MKNGEAKASSLQGPIPFPRDYGCKTCGIRLCSMECINAHLFEGRAIKSRLRPVQFHDWYTGESAGVALWYATSVLRRSFT